jgi:predicted permease
VTRLPRLARVLLRIAPVAPEAREDVQCDLAELYAERRRERGVVHAQWRLYRDIASLRRSRVIPSTPRSSLALLQDARVDVTYAVRLFARQPAILFLTIVGLSLGLGISTAAFSIMNAALRGEGLVDPDRAPTVLRTTERSSSTTWAYDEFVRLREGATRMRVEGVLTEDIPARLAADESAAPSVGVAFVSEGFFAATGARLSMGRGIEAGDQSHVGAPPVVVSHTFWTSRLNQDRAILGRTLWIGRTPATVVGVAALGFGVPHNRQVWMPLTTYGVVYGAPKRTPDTGLQVFGRLLPGVALSDAEAQLSGVAAGLPASAGGGESTLRVTLDPGSGLGRVSSAESLGITMFVFAVIALVLLLACANVATVLVSTAITRDREMGVRAALGASRGRIVRQLITESVFLGTIAAAIGLLFAFWAIPAVGTLIKAPAGSDLSPDLTVYLFLGIVTLITGVVAGLAPARYGRGSDLVTPLKGAGARPNRVAPRRLRSALVVTQAAVSVLLIVMAALFVRATFRAATIDVGFEATGLYAVSPGLGAATADDGAAVKSFFSRAIPELQAVPGISGVALSELTPFEGSTKTSRTREEPARVIHFNGARAEYFETVGLRLLAGRTFTREEVAARAPVAVVSESLARTYWRAQSPIGQPMPDQIPVPGGAKPVVVGVVADAIMARLHERNTFAFYLPIDPANERFSQLLIRVAPGSTGALEHASQRLRAIDPQADIKIISVGSLLEQEVGQPRMLALMSGVVGVIAIVLCVIGLYGLTASVVGQRTREMGVRVALGAEPRDLLRLLMWDSLRPVVVGLLLGSATALAVSRIVVSTMFFGMSAQDPMAYAGATTILLAAATLAVLAPARRATKVDPVFVLRQS